MPRHKRLAARYIALRVYRAVVKRVPSLMFMVVILTLFALAFSRLDAIQRECGRPDMRYAQTSFEIR